ncbi:aminodeoxychorismate/anthranilate synthase component II [Kangiella sp. HZ709]|uniref:anthranilate synthase component II n=1 Tax=Kangiella sp. HZ709 TaxID=2666328 RepID=UPI0012B0E2C0|nr:aminodeoxychorismate/anthranilate synthase component II [Kangiella sp. HZ709]
MRKLVWLLAILLTFGLIAHYFNDQTAIKNCLEQAGSFNYQTDFCSLKETYQGSDSFILNHLPFVLMWLIATVIAVMSVVMGIVKTPVEYEEFLKKKLNKDLLAETLGEKKRLLMIDNYDSFTYNLLQYFGEIGLELERQPKDGMYSLELIVKRNDEITLEQIAELDPDYLVISPGPCTPNESGISLEILKKYAGIKPILGVCLGHQAMAQVYGATIIRAEKVMHGKTSDIYHNGQGVFKDVPNPFKATRYHSLIIEQTSLPNEFEITAWTQDSVGNLEYIMGIQHKDLSMQGVQFHPESILSESGHQILRNFLSRTA